MQELLRGVGALAARNAQLEVQLRQTTDEVVSPCDFSFAPPHLCFQLNAVKSATSLSF